MLVGPRELLNRPWSGDIVVRNDATDEQKAAGLAEMLGREFSSNVTLAQADLDRQVIVMSGMFEFTAPTTAVSAATTRWARSEQAAVPRRIVAYRGMPHPDGWNTRGVANFVRTLSEAYQTPLLVEGNVGGQRQAWEMDPTAYPDPFRGGPSEDKQLDEVLANVAAQSKLRFRREHRTIKTWVLARSDLVSPPPPSAAATTTTTTTLPTTGSTDFP
jgi:hypothetical protein